MGKCFQTNNGAPEAQGSPVTPNALREASGQQLRYRSGRSEAARPARGPRSVRSPSALPPARRPTAATCFQLRYRCHRPTAAALTRMRQTAAASQTLRRRRGQRRASAVPASQRPPTNRAARRALSDVRRETECWGARCLRRCLGGSVSLRAREG